MKHTWLILAVSVIVVVIALPGCGNVANRSTIDRTTTIPPSTWNAASTRNEESVEGSSVAIHLDAQQRLVLATAKGYCAEPSPDALSAYVATLGVGASTPSQAEAAVSFANALQGSAASIGLRTQSITLMRDALYRMCEAANNGHLDEIHVARFLRRSQDLTAVILAVEQLTGAVAANQVILTPESSADASANLTANQQLLDEQRKTVQTHEEAVETANIKLATIQAAHNKAEEEYNTKQQAYIDAYNRSTSPEPPSGKSPPIDPSANPPANNPSNGTATADNPAGSAVAPLPEEETQLAELAAQANQAKSALETTERRLETAKTNLALAQQRLADAQEVLRVVETSRNSALTNATSESRFTGQFSSVVPRVKLDNRSTEAISKAVTEMVNTVVKRDDLRELCVSYVISDRELRQTESESQRQLIAAANEEVETATVVFNNAKSKYIEAEKKVLAANDAHLSAKTEFNLAQKRASEHKTSAFWAEHTVTELQKELDSLHESNNNEAQLDDNMLTRETKLKEEIKKAKSEATDARSKATEGKRKASEAEETAGQRAIELETATGNRDLAHMVKEEEHRQLVKLQENRDRLVGSATTTRTSEDVDEVAKSICRQLILPGK